MALRSLKQNSLLFILVFFAFFFVLPQKTIVAAKGSFLVHATVQIGACGNGIVEQGEQCDRVNMAGNTCESMGHGRGELRCDASCSFDYSSCEDSSNPLFTAVVPYYAQVKRCDAPTTPEVQPGQQASPNAAERTKTDTFVAATGQTYSELFVAYTQQSKEPVRITPFTSSTVYLTGYG